MQRECVLLIHGLGESGLHMLPLAHSLRLMGYRTVSITYPSTLYPTKELAEKYIRPALQKHAAETILHVVTHSLGGILLRYCLQMQQQTNIGRVVMMAPANHGSALLDLYLRNPLVAVLCGPAGQESGIGERCFPCTLDEKADYELGIIAGCLPLDPLSLFFLSWPQDGRASAESTKLKGMKDHIVLPASHEFITFHPLAAYQTYYFLKHGRFHSIQERPMNDSPKNKDENAKNSNRKVPVNLPSVKPEDYDVSIDSGNGSAGRKQKGQVVTPDKREDPARKEQKERGQLPLHDETIGGA